MIDAAIATLLATHLLASYLASAGPLLAAWLHWQTRGDDAGLARQVLPRLVTACLVAAVIGIALGVAMLAAVLWLADGSHRSALATVPASRWWNSVLELLFYFLCMGGYRYVTRGAKPLGRRWIALPLLAGTDLLFHFPPLFVAIGFMTREASLWDQPLERTDYWRIVLSGPVLAKVAHHWLASLVTATIATMALAWRPTVEATIVEQEPRRWRLVRMASGVGLAAALAQFPIGIWVLLTASHQQSLLGENSLATALFAGGILCALGLLRELAFIALGETTRAAIWRAAAALALTVWLMALAGSQV